VVNGHKSAAHTHLPDGGTVKMCIGRGMNCPIASSFILFWVLGTSDIHKVPQSLLYVLFYCIDINMQTLSEV